MKKKEKIALRLRTKRNSLKMTALEVSERIGLTRAAISNYENAIRTPSYETLEKFAKIYNCNPAYFVGWDKMRTKYLSK